MAHTDSCVCGDGWRFECCDLATGVVKAVLHPTAVTWDDNLAQVGNFQIDVASRSVAAAELWPHRTSLYISRINDDGISRTGYFGGLVEQYSGGVNGVTSVGGKSIDQYLFHRVLAGPNSGLSAEWTNQRAAQIAADLVNVYATTEGIPLTAGRLPSTEIRSAKFNSWEFKNIGQAIQELVTAGLEYRLSHTYRIGKGWRTQILFGDQVGTTRTLTLRSDVEGWEYGVNVDAKDHATWTYGIGAGDKDQQLEAVVSDPTDLYPYFHTVQSWKDAKTQAALNPLTLGWGRYHRDPIATPDITIAGLDHPSPSEMQTGDTVNVDIRYGIVTYEGEARILGTGWSIGTESPVKRTLTLRPVLRPAVVMLAQQPLNPTPPTPGGPVATEPKAGLVTYVTDSRIDEMSGMARSATAVGVYVHNDEVESPQVYLVGLPSGDTIGTVTFTGVTLPADGDPESIRRNPKTGKIVLFDGGNNDNERNTFAFYIFDDVGAGNHTVTPTKLSFSYPGGARLNAEAFMIHPTTGVYYIISKEATGQLFSYTPGQPAAVNMNRPMPSNVSDAAMSNGGGFAFIRSASRDVCDVYQTKTWAKVGEIPLIHVDKGESLTLDPDGKSFLYSSEGDNPPIYRAVIPAAWRDSTAGSGTGTAKFPADIFGKNWKLTLPIN